MTVRNKGRPGMTLCYCMQNELHVLLEVKERKSCGLESLGLEEWAHRCLLGEECSGCTLIHHFVQQCLWGLLGTKLSGDREMDKSQQSLQADRITHREFLYDVTDGWRGCHG